MIEQNKKKYEQPILEVVVMSPEDSIAASGGDGAVLWEEFWG